jgi:hypothetical protein
VGMFFSSRDWKTNQDRGKDERSEVQRSLMKTCSRVSRSSDWGEFSPSNRTMILSILRYIYIYPPTTATCML